MLKLNIINTHTMFHIFKYIGILILFSVLGFLSFIGKISFLFAITLLQNLISITIFFILFNLLLTFVDTFIMTYCNSNKEKPEISSKIILAIINSGMFFFSGTITIFIVICIASIANFTSFNPNQVHEFENILQNTVAFFISYFLIYLIFNFLITILTFVLNLINHKKSNDLPSIYHVLLSTNISTITIIAIVNIFFKIGNIMACDITRGLFIVNILAVLLIPIYVFVLPVKIKKYTVNITMKILFCIIPFMSLIHFIAKNFGEDCDNIQHKQNSLKDKN